MSLPQRDGAAWLIGGGECGDLVRAFDWSATSLGPIGEWPEHFRSTVLTLINSPIPKVLMWGPDHVMIYNDAYSEIVGGYHPRAIGAGVDKMLPEMWEWNSQVIEAGLRWEIQSFRDQPMVLMRNGAPEELVFDLFYTPVSVPGGSVGGVLCTVLETTKRVQAERDIRASNERFQAAMRAMSGVLWTNSADGQMIGEQSAWAELTGQAYSEYQGFGWASAVHPDDAAASIVAWKEAVAERRVFVFENRVRRHDGVWRDFAIRAVPTLNEKGEIAEWVGVHTDITERRLQEKSLIDHAKELEREIRHRKRAEEQLRSLNETLECRVMEAVEERRQALAALSQAQKMETIGKLTGGVAHDFNNLLQIISGNLHLLARDVAGNERAEKRVGNAMAGVSRGARLSSQLLAFGRRQVLEPKVVNVTRFVRGMDDMLRRAIGEGVEVETVASAGLWNTFIDPAQIENALLNLAINARDAMQGQGRLTIELGNVVLDDTYARSHSEVAAGQYVMLAVSDTGTGMTPEVLEKAFEPFFSTKPEGKGSGLGLSMVYGFVKQSGGHVKVYSEIGHGTTIRLYLPRAAEAEDVEVVTVPQEVVGGSETILVVEDDEGVRDTVVEMLGELGYRVLRAADASAGLSVIESGVPVDLLFTDVVMPGPLKSTELARKAAERLPGIAVLFTSGYTENSIVHGGRLDAGVELLSKPYTREALANKIRHVLASGWRGGSGTARERPPMEAPASPAGADAVPAPVKVMFVEDDGLIRMNGVDMLEEAGFAVVEAASAEEALRLLDDGPFDILVTDLNLPGMTGQILAEKVREAQPRVRVVFATGEPVVDDLGDAALLQKPYTVEDMLAVLRAG